MSSDAAFVLSWIAAVLTATSIAYIGEYRKWSPFITALIVFLTFVGAMYFIAPNIKLTY